MGINYAHFTDERFFVFFLKDFLFIRERERGTEGEGQADSMLGIEPDVGLDLRTLR